jgi:hypothetical protein
VDKACIDIHAAQAEAESCLKPAIQPFFYQLGKEVPDNDLYISFAINCFEKKQVQQSFLHLKHTRHPLLLAVTGLCGFDVNPVNSSSDYS